jgi:flotillin
VIILGLIFLCLSKQYKKVGPNEVLVVSGGKKRTIIREDGTPYTVGYRTCIGGGTFVFPLLESTQVMSLEVYTINIKIPEVVTSQGVPIMAEGVAQVKIKSDDYSLHKAIENFLGKKVEAIKEVAYQVLEGYFRATLGKMRVEEICSKREEVAQSIKSASLKDFNEMGLELISFSLKDISDTQGYIEALGKPQVAQVKRDATIAESETTKEAIIKEALAKKEGDIAKLKAKSEVAEANMNYEVKNAEYERIINEKRAQTDFAYELEKHKMDQEIKKEEYKTKLIEKEQAILLEEKEILRREKELEATIKKQAEAERFRIEEEARARVEAKKLEGKSEVEFMREKGKAEAEAMRYKAQSWKEYNEAAIYQMFIEKLPEIAKAIAEPLTKVEKIVIIGNSKDGVGVSRLTSEVTKMMAELPPIIESLGGVELKEILKKLPKIKEKTNPNK